MRTHQTLLLTVIVLVTSACAGNGIKQQAASPAAEMPPASAMAAAVEDSGPTGANADAADAVDAQATVRDPWEGFNRKIHSFNNAADKFVLRPLATGYDTVMPDPVKAGVSRFFANLGTPATAVNQALQGRPGDAAESLGRFVVNTTVGIGGVFDPASRFGMPERDDEDFGQTLATWGWRDSRYLVVPLLGPRTVRDTVAIVGDQPLSPIGQIQDSGTAAVLQMLQIVDGRARMLPTDEVRGEALDDYLFVRSAWTQRRNRQLRQNMESHRD